MIYNIIGLMSGSSLDGLDLAFTTLIETGGKWTYEIAAAECIPYSSEWKQKLQQAPTLPVHHFLRLHTEYGRYLAELVLEFIDKYKLHHKVHFIASHGHTVLHEPEHLTTFQLGDGAALSALTGLTVISDLRSKDIALGGQGAPIVPIADKLLFSNFSILLNIGGIANLTIMQDDAPIAYDICPANQVLNYFAQQTGQDFDAEGQLARKGIVNNEVVEILNHLSYYRQEGPKSLANTYSQELIKHLQQLNVHDALATATEHIAQQIAAAMNKCNLQEAHAMATGGGALNTFLVERINAHLSENIHLHVADETTIKFKEALAMALIGTLRWREEENILCSVTGASKNSVGGALWVN